MVILGQYTNMSDLLRELEQRFQCRRLECELEQLSHEFQQQCGVSRRLQLHPVRKVFSNGVYLRSSSFKSRNSGVTGIYCPALGEIKFSPSFW